MLDHLSQLTEGVVGSNVADDDAVVGDFSVEQERRLSEVVVGIFRSRAVRVGGCGGRAVRIVGESGVSASVPDACEPADNLAFVRSWVSVRSNSASVAKMGKVGMATTDSGGYDLHQSWKSPPARARVGIWRSPRFEPSGVSRCLT